jgi:hypothetical protein
MIVPSILAVLELSWPDLPSIVAGHGYDTGIQPGPPFDEDVDDDRSFGTVWIVGLVLLTLVTVAVLVAADPSASRRKARAIGPRAVPILVITAPLVAWSIASGGEPSPLIVERATGPTGARELLVWLEEDDMNTLAANHGERTVRVRCVDRDGGVVIDAAHKWPFFNEPGFDYPHAHQPAGPEQLLRASRCTLRGAGVRLAADVTGALSG